MCWEIPKLHERRVHLVADEFRESWGEQVQAPIEGLITGQVGEPPVPMTTHVLINAALFRKALQVAEQVDG